MEKMTVFWRLRSQYAFLGGSNRSRTDAVPSPFRHGADACARAAVYPGRCADGSFGIRYENPSFRFPMCVL